MVRLRRLTRDVQADVLAKVEAFNPGHSIKDRIAVTMIEDAERAGWLKPGGTIIEATTGNTGMGLVMAGVVKGYECIFTTTDKQSREKIEALRAFGAEVIVCPDVAPEDPRSCHSVSLCLERDTPNSWRAGQYDNPSNTRAHYEQTGPEIWAQTDGRITHLIAGVGTGGSISGAGRFLKERNPTIQVLGVDICGSVLTQYGDSGTFDTNEIHPCVTEGLGNDFVSANVDFDVIDDFHEVTDRDAAVMTRRIAREEGIFAGNSGGAAMVALLEMRSRFRRGDMVVVIFPDHGTRYVSKMFNDAWMREHGFLDGAAVAGSRVTPSNAGSGS
jgi:cystathionine beta-synthase